MRDRTAGACQRLADVDSQRTVLGRIPYEVEHARLTTEREILRWAAKVFRRGDALVSRFQFVADHSATSEVRRLCALVKGEHSSYAWLKAA